MENKTKINNNELIENVIIDYRGDEDIQEIMSEMSKIADRVLNNCEKMEETLCPF
jgi:predicted P-loop ATPase/GTPase